MREPLFIKKNKQKWEEYDAISTDNPDELSNRFTKILDDLSYAQTYYPKGRTVQYLNERAVRFYNQIYKNKKETFANFKKFWVIDLPLVIQRNHKLLLISLLLFLFCTALGILSAVHDPAFLNVISPGYVEMTLENIRDGDPFGVYANSNNASMFFYIAFNNISLAFVFDFIGGIFFAIGSIYSTFLNGVMFGSFYYMFYNANLGAEFGLVVMIHGTFELFAFVLAVAAGFRLFHSTIFIGTFSRVESIKKGFAEGVQLMILVFILLFVAAILESYITRLAGNSLRTDGKGMFIPIWASVAILVICTAIIIWYFVLYPIKVYNKNKQNQSVATAEVNLGKVFFENE